MPEQVNARVCAYDRASIGRSDRAPTRPRTCEQMADDLYALLGNADLPGPFVLGSHGMAGLTARMFASKYGDELAGLILVDSRHPEGTGRVLEQFTAELADDWFGAYNLRMDYLTPYRHPLKATESWDSATSE